MKRKTRKDKEKIYREKYDVAVSRAVANLSVLLEDLSSKYDAEKITIQSGGSLNGQFLRDNLLDYVNIVIAPLLVGGKDVSTLIDGESIHSPEELDQLKALELIECKKLDHSYIQLRYKVKK